MRKNLRDDLNLSCFLKYFIHVIIVLFAMLPIMCGAHDSDRLIDAVQKTKGAVVKLIITKRRQADEISALQRDDSLRVLNDYFEQNVHDAASLFKKNIKIIGSGLVLNQQGLIVSSAHLTQGAKKISVELTSGQSLKAKIIGEDAVNDISLIKVKLKENLALPSSVSIDSIKIGQAVYAIGAPFGFAGSVATGIVSAVRSHSKFLQKIPLVQTDVAINPGNSGGPVFDYNGKVIGITTQIMSTNGGAQGVSFAVPMEYVMKSVKRIQAKHKRAENL